MPPYEYRMAYYNENDPSVDAVYFHAWRHATAKHHATKWSKQYNDFRGMKWSTNYDMKTRQFIWLKIGEGYELTLTCSGRRYHGIKQNDSGS